VFYTWKLYSEELVKLDSIRSNVDLLFPVKTTCAKKTVQYAVTCLLMLVKNKSSGFCRQGARVMLTRARAIRERPALSETGVRVG
jgi:hypothetical protein